MQYDISKKTKYIAILYLWLLNIWQAFKKILKITVQYVFVKLFQTQLMSIGKECKIIVLTALFLSTVP